MKIYEIGTGYTPIPAKVAAATESVVEELTKAFIEQGVEVEIIDIYSKERLPNKLPIIEVKVPSVFSRSDVSLGIVHKLKRVVYSLALANKLRKLLKSSEEKIVLHFHNQYNMFFFVKCVSRKLRSKAIVAYTNHNGVWNMPWEEAEGILKKRYFQEISSMKKADLIFVLNSKTKENIEKHLGIPKDSIIKINNGVNTDVYHPLQQEKIYEIKKKYDLDGKRVILQVGSINENKGQGRTIKQLVTTLKENKDLIFAYIGEIVSQEYHKMVENDICNLGLQDKVIYLGSFSPGSEMNEMYNIADLTTCSSNYEGFPLVCVESLSAATPVMILSDAVAFLGKGTVKCTSTNECCSELELILNNDKHYLTLCDEARNNVEENYSWNKVAANYLNVFNA